MSEQLQAILARTGTLTDHELEVSLRLATARNMSLWDSLVLERQIPEEALAEAFSRDLKLPRVRLDSVEIQTSALRAVAAGLARKHTCLPLRLARNKIVLAMSNPLDEDAIQDVQFASSRQVERVVASRTEILNGIEIHYPSSATPRDAEAKSSEPSAVGGVAAEAGELIFDRVDSLQPAESAPAVHLSRVLVCDAIKLQASDIHIEPGPHEMRVRLRVDGVLRDHLQLPRWMHAGLVSRIKILAKLDIAQQRLPQDGRIRVQHDGLDVDLRVSTLPTHFGEKVVLRLLGSARTPTLHALGLSDSETASIDDALSQPQGLILVTGPTGAGKSTTLYSMLARRQSAEVNIVTIEDPIEYQVTGLNQVQVDVKAGLTFASCLRAILRQDPDVILVGEVRDLETAEIAFQAALTGHLVFSTLHTNGSLAAIERLIDLGLRPLLFTSATNLIVAQRLARRICTNCREPYLPAPAMLQRLHLEAGRFEFQHGRGCALCGQTGYSGRVGIFEILRLTPRLRELVTRSAAASELRDAATAGGTRFLLDDGLDKVRQGLTTVEEILRVIRIDPADDRSANKDIGEGSQSAVSVRFS